jgi:hypothetical protein
VISLGQPDLLITQGAGILELAIMGRAGAEAATHHITAQRCGTEAGWETDPRAFRRIRHAVNVVVVGEGKADRDNYVTKTDEANNTVVGKQIVIQ